MASLIKTICDPFIHVFDIRQGVWYILWCSVLRTSCMFYQVMDGDICIQDRRSEADRRIRTNTHRVGPILFANNCWRPLMAFLKQNNIFIRISISWIGCESSSFWKCPPKSWLTSELDERDFCSPESGPWCGGWHWRNKTQLGQQHPNVTHKKSRIQL